MPAGEEENSQRRRYSLRDDLIRLRELRRGSKDLSCKISRSEFRLAILLSCLLCHLDKTKQYSEHRTDWDETQSARGENQNRPTSSGGPGGGYATGGPVGGAPGNPAAAAAAQSSVFSAGQPETAGTILSPTHGLDTSEHDGAGSYVYSGMVATGHNGTGGESY
jgi:hypothetical protein